MSFAISSTQKKASKNEEDFEIKQNEAIVALGGNPNVGKSTVFNALTGLKQHTGNWPGKTIVKTGGRYNFKGQDFFVIDLPGTYSLVSDSLEEEIARNFLCFGNHHVTVIVLDATCLERNLNMALQVLEITQNVVFCVNLIDQAKKRNIHIDTNKLSKILKVPVVATSAIKKTGMDNLEKAVYKLYFNPNKEVYSIKYDKVIEDAVNNIISVMGDNIPSKKFVALKLLDADKKIINEMEKCWGVDLLNNPEICRAVASEREKLEEFGINKNNFCDRIVSSIVTNAEQIANEVVDIGENKYKNFDIKIDKILTSKTFGIPIMIAFLGFILWITIVGANYPSQWLSNLFTILGEKLDVLLTVLNTPLWLHSAISDGLFKTLSWVVSVMLPPMAIFFPLFTLMEDLGYLPRVAFNLDNYFKKCSAHGKQCLTMCMGFGCNAAGVIGARIINSPREQLIAIITNNFVPCNGRFPTLITISSIFVGSIVLGGLGSVISSLSVLAIMMIGILMTFLSSYFLSKTFLKGTPSHFMLELPPYRKPKIGEVIYRSIFDRTLFVLGRAVIVAAPAGILIWIAANLKINNISLLMHLTDFLNPFAKLMGLDGCILIAFILGLPANEIVIPIILMCYLSTGSLTEFSTVSETVSVFIENGWTIKTAVCAMLFTLLHFPCATTLLTIKKETKNIKWTLISFLLPTMSGIVICILVNFILSIFI